MNALRVCTMLAAVGVAAVNAEQAHLRALHPLKSVVGQVVSKSGVQAGVGYPDLPKPWYSLQKDVDFVNNDFANAPSKDADGCALICQNTQGCRAFSWNDYNGGTCWLKNSLTETKAKTGVTSSVVLSRTPSCRLSKDCDIYGIDIAKISSPTAEGCCALCLANPKCRAFTWNNWNGGTCYFKPGLGKQRGTSGTTTGFI